MQPEYYTVVLDIEKFNRWFNSRKQNDKHITKENISARIGYSKGFLSQLLNQEKYDIEISGRFIGTFLKTFGLSFDEIFKIIPARSTKDNDDYKYKPVSNLRRYEEENLHKSYYAR